MTGVYLHRDTRDDDRDRPPPCPSCGWAFDRHAADGTCPPADALGMGAVALDQWRAQQEDVMSDEPDELMLDQIIADIDARGWCYEIDNFRVNSERGFLTWRTIRRADVGVNIYAEGNDGDRKQLAYVYGLESLAEALRAAYEAARGGAEWGDNACAD